MQRFIYADNAATTRVSERVLNAMLPYFTEQYGNASSVYRLGREAEAALEGARKTIADALGAEPSEIFFTSGGSESDNWAIRGTAERMAKKGRKHIITTAFEHHAVLHSCEYLEKNGFTVTYLPVGDKGLVSPEAVREAIRPDTALVTIMYANNEIGTIQPISEIGAICRDAGIPFHTDAVQAVGNVPINVKEQNIDLLSLSGHKIHAQKGIGVMYAKRGMVPPNLIYGGGQERGKRAGTENIPAIIGLAEALKAATENIPAKIEKVTALRNRLIDGILEIPRTRLNGDRDKRLCGNCNISILGAEGEFLILSLDHKGIAASSGSACTTGSLDPSHVLLALGLCHEIAHGSLRLSISEETTEDDIDYMIEAVRDVAKMARSMSPLWEDIQSGKIDFENI